MKHIPATCLFLFFTSVLLIACHTTPANKPAKTYNAICIRVFDSVKNSFLTGFDIYDITNYAEGVSLRMETVQARFACRSIQNLFNSGKPCW